MDWDTREAVARLLGIASTALPSATSTALISELVSKTTEMQKLRFVASFWNKLKICNIEFQINSFSKVYFNWKLSYLRLNVI